MTRKQGGAATMTTEVNENRKIRKLAARFTQEWRAWDATSDACWSSDLIDAAHALADAVDGGKPRSRPVYLVHERDNHAPRIFRSRAEALEVSEHVIEMEIEP